MATELFQIFLKKKKNARRGRHSGEVSLYSVSLSNNFYGKRDFFGFDNCVVFLLKGSLFNLVSDIIMCFPYISPEGSPVYNETGSISGVELFEDNLLQVILKYPDARLL